jgi:Protein kinase domain
MSSPTQGDGGLITAEEFESAMSKIISIRTELEESKLVALNNSQFLQITRLLEISGKHEWSLRPRTYAVLRMMGRVDIMDSFVAGGLFDISLPYSERTFPDALKSPGTRSMFLELQSLVLTEQAMDVENSGGRHRHLPEDGDVHFRRIRKLGRGGFGEVDHVWSRLSHNEFARKRMPRGRTFNKDKAAIADFERELEILKRLSHHHLVKLIGSYTDPKYVGLIMLPVADCNLEQFLEASPFPATRIPCLRHFYGCLSSALLHLHINKIRHKDIKPKNILVHGENVLFTDFGTSLDWTETGQSTTVSRPNAVSVTYCAPEVAAWEVSSNYDVNYTSVYLG